MDLKTMQRSCIDMALEGERLCKAGDCRAGVQFFEAAVQIGTNDLKTLSAIYSQLGNAYFHLQEYGKSLEYHRHDLNLARTIGDRLGEGKASGNLGNTLKVLGKYDEAYTCCQHHLEIARELGDKNSEARALYNLGSVFHAKGKQAGRSTNQDPGDFPPDVLECLVKATEYYEENLKVVRDLGDRAAQGRACGNLGNTHYLLGNFSQAIKYHTERLSLAREFGDRSAERRAYSNLGNAHIFLGEFDSSVNLYGKTLQIAIELGDRALEAQACYSLGNTYTLKRDYEHAIEYHIRHLRIAQELKDRIGEGRACWSLGNCYGTLGCPEKALLYASQHLEISKEIGDEAGQATALVNVMDLKMLLGFKDEPVRRVNSYKEKTEGLTETDAQGRSVQRRLSMEHMEIVKLTPEKGDGDKSAIGLAPRPKSVGRGQRSAGDGAVNGEKRNGAAAASRADQIRVQTSSPEGYDEDQFFELLSRFQSRRIDDQRCCSSVLGVAGDTQEDKENDGLKANSPNSDEFLDMVAGIQGARMNDQRATLGPFPGLNNSHDVIGQFATNRREDSLDDQFFEMLIRCQGARIEDQRSELVVPVVHSAPTVPDEDFMNLIHRFQSSRLEEQRSSLPTVDNDGGPIENQEAALGQVADVLATPKQTPGGGASGSTRKKSVPHHSQSTFSITKPWSSMKRRPDKK